MNPAEKKRLSEAMEEVTKRIKRIADEGFPEFDTSQPQSIADEGFPEFDTSQPQSIWEQVRENASVFSLIIAALSLGLGIWSSLL